MTRLTCAPCTRGDHGATCLGVVQVGKHVGPCWCEDCKTLAMERAAREDERRAAW